MCEVELGNLEQQLVFIDGVWLIYKQECEVGISLVCKSLALNGVVCI